MILTPFGSERSLCVKDISSIFVLTAMASASIPSELFDRLLWDM
jgi:hypothetical protein